MQLPKTKTAKTTNPWDARLYIYGPPKIGKTALCAHIPDALFIATEPGHKHLDIYKVNVSDWKGFKEALGLVKKGDHDFKVVVIDTIDNALHFCEQYICEELKVKAPGDARNGTGWTRLNNEFRNVFMALNDLPYGFVFVGHGKNATIKVRGGSEYDKFDSALGGKPRIVALGMMDQIFYFGNTTTVKSGKVVDRRILYTQSSPHHVAGGRWRLPPEILMNGTDKENYSVLMSAITKAIKE